MGRRSSVMRHRGRIIGDSRVDPRTMFGTNLLQWLRADMGTVIDGSNNVSSLPDQSGNERHATQASSAARPSFSAATGPGGRPCISSGLSGAAFLDMGASGVDMTGKGWTQCGVVLSETNPGTAATFWTTRSAPAGGTVSRMRRDGGLRLSYVLNSATGGLSFTTVTQPDGVTPPIWIAFIHTCTAAGVRNFYCFGDKSGSAPTQPGTQTTTNTGNFAAKLAEGYIFRDVAAIFWPSISIFEKFDIQGVVTPAQILALQSYWRALGIDT